MSAFSDHALSVMMKHFNAVFDWAGPRVRQLITHAHPSRDATILDVGAGQGKYRVLLADYPNVDAIEAWEPYVNDNNLAQLYRYVFNFDVYDYVESSSWGNLEYDVVILGDVLEHLTRERAQYVLRCVYDRCDDVIVVVPYEYPQDEEDGNLYQIHQQDDLTVELMAYYYSELDLVTVQLDSNGKPFKGIYRRRQ